ncbi:IS110 family transposase [Variovorax sp. MHTC-1]|uniref:IS110 family transposase n=1 Tax=Variovorax sp. MHTC-1 TaxID=2495593 RepID=UPI000F897253|nr:IS110 family transposase [Variovorax sp. MHTC-1]RST46786.1 IS110 family transposase [Variovorax sp. MHTC-1]
MEQILRVGVDLSKRVIQLHGVDAHERVVLRRSVSVDKFPELMVQLPACLVAMEACSTAHYWARKLAVFGHTVRLIAPQFVSPYRKSGTTGKNDAADAEAICEAASRPTMRFVPAKNVYQQGIMTLHRMRQGWIEERTALINRLRGLLAEFGVALPQRTTALQRIPELLEDASNEIPGVARSALMTGWQHLSVLNERVTEMDRNIRSHAKADESARRIMELPGVGALTASALVAAVGDAREFKNSRQFAAWLGLTPSQNSSGGKVQLGQITKRGDGYVRMLLIMGARSALLTAPRRDDRISRWLLELEMKVGWRKALVALANKHARIIWNMLTKKEAFVANHIPPGFQAKAMQTIAAVT